jgi:hypothetical protein
MGSGLVGRGKEMFCGFRTSHRARGNGSRGGQALETSFRPLLTYIANVNSWCNLCVNA